MLHSSVLEYLHICAYICYGQYKKEISNLESEFLAVVDSILWRKTKHGWIVSCLISSYFVLLQLELLNCVLVLSQPTLETLKSIWYLEFKSTIWGSIMCSFCIMYSLLPLLSGLLLFWFTWLLPVIENHSTWDKFKKSDKEIKITKYKVDVYITLLYSIISILIF